LKTPLGPALLSLLACLGAAAPQEKAATTPGAHLLFKEKSRDTEQGFEMVHYALKAEGLPKDQRYALYGRWMDGSSKEAARGLRLDEAGILRDDKGEPFTLSLGQTFPGEYITIALVSEDGKAKAFGEITVYPIQAEGKGGCRLVVRPLDPKGQTFAIIGTGFGPGKKLKIASTSVNESMHETKTAGPDGTLPKQVILPAVIGRTGGEASYEVSDSDCTVKVLYKWGDEMRGKSAVAHPPAP
jgi:hypothetical protein